MNICKTQTTIKSVLSARLSKMMSTVELFCVLPNKNPWYTVTVRSSFECVISFIRWRQKANDYEIKVLHNKCYVINVTYLVFQLHEGKSGF